MDYALTCGGENAKYIFYAPDIPSYIYYIFIPSIIITFFLGLFIFLKNSEHKSNRLFFGITSLMVIWMITILGNWAQNDPKLSVFFDHFGVIPVFILAILTYFVLENFYSNPKFFNKILIFSPLLPVIALFWTRFNIASIELSWCETKIGNLYWYVAFLSVIYIIAIFYLLIKKIKEDLLLKNKPLLILVGFVLWAFFGVFFGIILPLIGYPLSTLWSPIACVLFTVCITWAIVKYEFLDIKLMSAQALIIALLVLISSQYFFIANNTNRILTGVTLVLAGVGGYVLIKSVKLEIKKQEELQLANIEIEKRNAVILDRNERIKKANKEVEKRNKKLESANDEITEKKNQLQKISDSLAVANVELKKLDQAKDEFISRASHDLRTPITGIKGYVSLLEEGSYGKVTPDQQEALNKTTTIINGMSGLIEDLFSASKIESGCMKYEFAKTKIEDICQEVVDTLYIKAKEHNLYLKYEKPKIPLPELMIDKKVIREAISNLVDNAVKYTKNGGVTLSLEQSEKSNYIPPITRNPEEKNTSIEGPVVRITVADTGIGIPKDEIPRLFVKLSRGKDTTRLNAGGTGLGLYLCKGFIEGNRGKIWIESEGEGKGSRFVVEIPVGIQKK